jgi:NAD(P)-dependent dehydrogenase (short-subunit alcohol dehydrogenase family)
LAVPECIADSQARDGTKVLATTVLAPVRGNVSASTACVRFSAPPRRWPEIPRVRAARLSSWASEGGCGRIVNVPSIAAIGWAMLGNAFYAVTKAEVVKLTKRITMELGSHGITANAVGPGVVRTEMA